MNLDYEKKLEAAIDRELRNLPELSAPATLTRRVLAALEQRANLPWYRRSWEVWPAPVRAASFALLAVLFGGLCFGVWMVPHTEGFTVALHQVGGWFSPVVAVWNALGALATAMVLAFRQLGTGFLIGAVVAVALAWALCLGLGTACVRLAFARQ
jgi:hypothetical protein